MHVPHLFPLASCIFAGRSLLLNPIGFVPRADGDDDDVAFFIGRLPVLEKMCVDFLHIFPAMVPVRYPTLDPYKILQFANYEATNE